MGSSELVVDGTNLAWAWSRTRGSLIQRDFGAAQRLLVDTASGSALRSTYSHLTFVFDGPPPHGGPHSRGSVRVLYPDPGQSADERILELVAQLAQAGQAPAVATSDRQLRELVRARGGTTLGGMELLTRLDPRAGTKPERREAGGAGDRKPRPSRTDTESWLREFEERR